jgi:hypothetical protein
VKLAAGPDACIALQGVETPHELGRLKPDKMQLGSVPEVDLD